MNDEQHIPIIREPLETEPPASQEARSDDPVYTDLPGGEGVQSGEEGEMPTVSQTVEYGRTAATASHPAPPPAPDIPQSPTGAGGESHGAGQAGRSTAESEQAHGTSEAEQQARSASEAEQDAYDGQWEEVVASLTVLGDSIGRWARAAARDPNYRRHADELTGALRGVAGRVGEAVDDVAQSEVAQGFKEAAVKTGGTIYETGQRVYRDAVAPGLVDAFRGAAEGLRFAAQKLEESRERAQEEATRAEAHAAQAQRSAEQAPSGSSGETQPVAEPVIEPPDPTEI